jgi:hypothetical protein
MVDFLSKIICRSSNRPLKSEIFTFRGILKFSAGLFAEGFYLRGFYRGKACLDAE